MGEILVITLLKHQLMLIILELGVNMITGIIAGIFVFAVIVVVLAMAIFSPPADDVIVEETTIIEEHWEDHH
jgi:hypothetical protein